MNEFTIRVNDHLISDCKHFHFHFSRKRDVNPVPNLALHSRERKSPMHSAARRFLRPGLFICFYVNTFFEHE